MSSDEDVATMQCKLTFDKSKFEIVPDDGYSYLAKTDVGEDVELVMADTEGNFIINTIKGKGENNTVSFTFKVKENVELKNEKISLEFVDSNINLNNEKNYILVGKQEKISYYLIIFSIIVLMILIVVIKNRRKGGKKK